MAESRSLVKKVEEDIRDERIRQLENAVLQLTADIQHISGAVRDCQDIIVKIATNQQQVAERVSMWPFIKVDAKSRKKPGGSIDKSDI
jgi:hypothetical protein